MGRLANRARLAVLVPLLLAGAWFAERDTVRAVAFGDLSREASWPVPVNERLVLRRVDPARLFAGQIGEADMRKVARSARAALRDEPLDPVALRSLALASATSGQTQAQRLLGLAHRVSRRDTATEMALLDRAVMHGDYRAAFAHVDHALSVSPESGEPLFVPLAAVLTDPRARAELSRHAARPWFRRYLAAALGASTVTGEAAHLLIEARVDLSDPSDPTLARALGHLASAGRHTLARQVAHDLAGIDRAAFDAFGFNAVTLDRRLVPYAWRFPSGSARARWTDGRGIDFELEPEARAILLERLTTLSAGRYALIQEIGETGAGTVPLLSWELTCRAPGGDARVWAQPVPLGQRLVRYRSAVTIPDGCDTQVWRLRALAPDRQTPVTFRLARLDLEQGR